MQRKRELQITYESGRKSLLGVIAFTAVNVLLPLIGSDRMFLFTAYFPYVIAVNAVDPLFKAVKIPMILIGCVLPIAAIFLCWLMSSKERYKWLTFSAVLFGADTLFMLGIFAAIGFSAELIINYALGAIFHAYILWGLFKGISAAKKLVRGEYTDDIAEGTAMASGDDIAAAIIDKNQQESGIKRYTYSKEYAKMNGADKSKHLVIAIVGYLVLCFGSFVPVMLFEDSALAALIMLVMLFGSLIGLIISAVKISDFTKAGTMWYEVDATGLLTSCRNEMVSLTYTAYDDIKLLEEHDNRWVVQYDDKKGRTKKAVIPKAYPGLEDYMNKIK